MIMSDKPDPGCLPPWNVGELPKPRDFTWKNIIAVIGPGTIALSMSIGGGEWLLGPANVVKYGTSILWIVTLGICFQLATNYEFIRYTLYTGEPVMSGFMRTRPGPAFWACFYLFLALCQVGWPAWAANSATTIFAMSHGRLPTAEDGGLMVVLRIAPFLATIGIVAVGGKIERMLEWVNWFMVIFIVVFLLVVDILFVPAEMWWKAVVGHFQFGSIPLGPDGTRDWVLLGALAGFAGNGGIGNIFMTNWIRDKGYGMASIVGFIPSAVGGKSVKVSPTGSVFETTPENVSRWKGWWKYVHVDQTVVWAGGCFLGMYLNVLLAGALVPKTDPIEGSSAGAIQAKYVQQAAVQTLSSETAGKILWFTTLLTGFWVLFGTQLCIVDGFVRLSTDILWTGSSAVRRWARDDIRRVYYGLLVFFALWGCVAINAFKAPMLMQIAANAAGFILAAGGTHVLILNRRLPRELRARAWLTAVVALGVLFSFFSSTMAVYGAGRKAGWW
jgi:hypothetical protein